MNDDSFEISIRIFGQEIVAMSLKSQSRARNWVVLSILCMMILIAMVAEFGPALKGLLQ